MLREVKVMIRLGRLIGVSAIVVLVSLAAVSCGSESPSAPATPRPTPIITPIPTVTPDASTVNVVEAFDLEDAARIEVFELAVDGPGYLLRTVFSDEEIVDRLVKSLDEDLVLGPRMRCPENFRLRFFFAGGRTETLGLVCFSEPDLVRGDDAVFGFHDAPLPDDFQLAFRTAMSVAPRPDQVASDSIVPRAIAKVVEAHPELAEYTNFDYERLDLTPPMTVGASRFAYQSLDWRVEVSWAVVAEPVFDVKATSLRTSVEWEGQFESEPITRRPTITPSNPVISDQVLELVLSRLADENGDLSGLSRIGFERYDLAFEGPPGGAWFGYRNRDWELDISWPVVSEPVFSVAVRAPGVGFSWSGEVMLSELTDGFEIEPEAM